MSQKIYTYRGGKKVALTKSDKEIVVRDLPENLSAQDVEDMEQVSSKSTRLTLSKKILEAEMAKHRKSAPTHHAYYEVENKNEFLITDRVMITFLKGTKKASIDKIISKYALIKRAKFSNTDYLFQLTHHTDMNPVKLVVKLTEDEKIIEFAEHDLNQQIQTQQFVPSDSDYLRQWHLHTYMNSPEFDHRASSNCEQAWNLLGGYGSRDVVIAVTDDGCRLDHSDFDSQDKFSAWGFFEGLNLISDRNPIAHPDFMYEHSSNHGTNCCGVIAAENDGALTVGAAPSSRLLPIKWESSGSSLFISDSKLLIALNFIANKADIMSNSWGASPSSNYSVQVLNRIEELSVSGGRRGKGIIFLWAAGNENCPIHETTPMPVPYTSGWQGTTWVKVKTSQIFSHNLVDLPGVMFVAALASTAMRSHYSNYGYGIDICAPSNNLHKYHRLELDGLGITTADGNYVNQVTDLFGGTSSATPLVAGIAALVIAANPQLSAAEVISILKETASKDLNFTPHPKTPPASFDKNPTWDVSPISPHDVGVFQNLGLPEGTWSPWFGHGKVDAAAAVIKALGRKPQQGPKFVKKSKVDKSIPDASERGILAKIKCNHSFTLTDIEVTVEIDHTYIGDLRVILTSPSGTDIVLHDRTGSNGQNLYRSYRIDDHSILASLIGEAVEGNWELRVYDLAKKDTGQLNAWGLDIKGEEKTQIFDQNRNGEIIPDGGELTRKITLHDNATVRDMEVFVDITHGSIVDLNIQLISPSGQVQVLHDHSGGNSDNIIRTYSMTNTVGMDSFSREPVAGDWILKIKDIFSQDQGKFNMWSLNITV